MPVHFYNTLILYVTKDANIQIFATLLKGNLKVYLIILGREREQ